ncbi:MAG: LuxR C-terminal-related transcriptional regulator [Erysipelotrichaceae bacterium]|nr:LuxR C-terminal-related transcriptional regulator [Erysipelotrichaceae bacterium]
MYSILTKREKEIFDYLIDNYSTTEIANKLQISEKTVRNHISNVIIKLDVKNRSQAVVKLLLINELHLKRF